MPSRKSEYVSILEPEIYRRISGLVVDAAAAEENDDSVDSDDD